MRVKKVIYFTICLLLIGLYLSCTGEKLDDGGTSPTIDYNLLRISSFSVVDGNENPINDTNAIPVDVSFLLTFDQSLGAMADYINHLKSQIKFINMEGSLIDLNVEPTQITNQVKIVPTTDLSYDTTYQLIVKEGLTIGDYRVIDDITYPIATEKNSDSSLVVIYDSKEIFPNKNYITILLVGSDPGSVMFTLEVGEGATLQNGNDDLRLDKNNRYTTNMDFSSRATHSFIVTAQDGSTPVTYIIGVSQKQADSKEILSFIFLERDHTHLKANIVMDVNTNNRTITKTVTNVEKITGLIPYIFHSGSNISPASRVAQDFSTNNTYTVTAIDKTTSSYTVTLTSYYGITFDANGGLIGGNPIADEYILYGKKVSPPSDPFLEHYGFKGWYDAPIDGNTFDFDIPITTQTTIYAQWTNKQYQVRFYRGNSLLGTVPIISLTTIPAPSYPIPSISGKIYKWYSDSGLTQAYDINTQVTNDLALYADEITVSFETIIEDGTIPIGLNSYGEMSEQIFSRYNTGATVIPRYITTNGNGDGSSWSNAANDIQAMIDEITDADDNKVYVILAALGTYKPDASYVMKNHVALVGGFTAGSYDRMGVSFLSGNSDKRVFYNNDLDRTALLYGVVIANGNSIGGSGMYNNNSSPTLINITFLSNQGTQDGGGMYNHSSSPTLINVTFSDNVASEGGGMYNHSSSPILINVAFSDNVAIIHGGGMYDYSSSPTLINVTFSDNKASVVFDNILRGGGIYHNGNGEPLTLINTILWSNDNGNIYLLNDTSDTETVNLYYSVIEGGIIPSTTAIGIRLESDDTNVYPIEINSKEIITDNPGLGPLADYGGEIDTTSIDNNSPAKDKGVYVRGVKAGNTYSEANLYYSENNTDWYSDPGLTMQKSPPNNADDLTGTDARGYGRVGRPDMGTYEVDGIEP